MSLRVLLSFLSSTRKRCWLSITWSPKTMENMSVARRIKWDNPRRTYSWTSRRHRISRATWRSTTSRTIRWRWFGSAVSTAACRRPIKYDGDRRWIMRIVITTWTSRPVKTRPLYPACRSGLITCSAWRLSTRREIVASCRTSSKFRHFVSRR